MGYVALLLALLALLLAVTTYRKAHRCQRCGRKVTGRANRGAIDAQGRYWGPLCVDCFMGSFR